MKLVEAQCLDVMQSERLLGHTQLTQRQVFRHRKVIAITGTSSQKLLRRSQ